MHPPVGGVGAGGPAVGPAVGAAVGPAVGPAVAVGAGGVGAGGVGAGGVGAEGVGLGGVGVGGCTGVGGDKPVPPQTELVWTGQSPSKQLSMVAVWPFP